MLLLIPLLEIVGIVGVSRGIGGWWTFLLLLLGAVAGVIVVSRAGARAWRALRQDATEGIVPGRDVGDPALMLLGGLLLIFPGFLTDLVGLLLLLPVTRSGARAGFRLVFGRRVPAGVVPGQPVPGMSAFRRSPAGSAPGEVIEGEVVAEWPPGEEEPPVSGRT